MRTIDIATWPRRKQFEWLSAFDFPHFNLCAPVDITIFYPAVKRRSVSFTVAVVYVLSRAANDIPEFRTRIRGQTVVEHDIVHPSITLLTGDDLFSFCPIPYAADFDQFAQNAERQMAYVRAHPALEDEPGRDDFLFMTSVPWVSFTGLMHPMHLTPVDSFPRLAWGKYFTEGQIQKMPLSVQAHHALLDGVHAGRYFELVQDYLNQPDFLL